MKPGPNSGPGRICCRLLEPQFGYISPPDPPSARCSVRLGARSMTPVDRQLPEVHIALEGHFNPLISQPAWPLQQGLIDEQDLADVLEHKAAVVSPEFSGARYPWAMIETTRTSMAFASTPGSETPQRVRELVIGVFRLLSHTPVTSITVSHSWHF